MIPQQYEYVRTLGRGSFGEVVEAIDTNTNQHVAVKKLKRTAFNRHVEPELMNHRKLQHPFIVRMLDAFLTPNNINIVMEFANSGNLFDLVNTQNRFSEDNARCYFQQLIVAVDYCHRKGISHRDIKLENILLQANLNAAAAAVNGVNNAAGNNRAAAAGAADFSQLTVKLCDFGYNKAMALVPETAVGTLRYMSPQVLHNFVSQRRAPYDGDLADVWSCGIVLYTSLVGQYPYDVSQLNVYQQMMQMRAKAHRTCPYYSRLTAECRDLIDRMLAYDPANRITVAEILAHSWFVRNIPPGLLDMNGYYLAQPDGNQPDVAFLERLLRVVEAGGRQQQQLQ